MATAKKKPDNITLRTYQVGFGDCFLLTFHYPKQGRIRDDRHVLIDFGSSHRAHGTPTDQMVRIAKDIKKVCGTKLHAIVATHRHRDHISGFSTKTNGKGSGDIIASLDPDVVVQPWTEDPDAAPDATRPTRVLSDGEAHLRALASMQSFSESVATWIRKNPSRLPAGKLRALNQLAFLGEMNLSNRNAVDNLMAMGTKKAYVHFGSKSGLENVLPGVNVQVLGPPTLEQSDIIRKQRSKDAAEFWHLQMASGRRLLREVDGIFPDLAIDNYQPPYARWMIRRMESLQLEQTMRIVRELDKQLNNTSVILLFEVGDQKLLFPGDAQLENWSYCLNHAPGKTEIRQALADVSLYKVGHHGSLNATPKTLWNLFERRSAEEGKRLVTAVSTMEGPHGDRARGTEVPRSKLIHALRASTDLITTEEFRDTDLCVEHEFPVDVGQNE